ncbi:MAG: hypothetical protein NZ480_09385 [Bdellovibrionaceae bacterium]|nr:hypothetical protein [Pseudobdellovibrionaceae bacterium]MDW8189761.1 hypothetical protein [Pseudobdellovibrionaceae bacterium]
MIPKEVENVIIGSGWAGLLLGSLFSLKDKSFLILDKEKQSGGNHHVIPTHSGAIWFRDFLFYEHSELTCEILEILKRFDQNVSYEIIPNSILVFKEGRWDVFQGFETHQPKFLNEIQYFFSPQKIHINRSLWEIFAGLEEKIRSQIILEVFVNKMHVESDQSITLQLANKQVIRARHVFFTGNFHQLLGLLPKEIVSTKLAQQIRQPKLVTGILLSLICSNPNEIGQSNSLYFSSLNIKEEHIPLFGSFTAISEKAILTQWLTFLDAKDSDDNELVTHHLKSLKKNVKKFFPNLSSDRVVEERIELLYDRFGNIQTNHVHQYQLKGINSLWILCPQFNSSGGSLSFLEPVSVISKTLRLI